MKRTTKYVALDVHQATTVTTVREQSRRVITRGILTTEAGVLQLNCEAANSRGANQETSADVRDYRCLKAVAPV